jgi:hypothetical protein
VEIVIVAKATSLYHRFADNCTTSTKTPERNSPISESDPNPRRNVAFSCEHIPYALAFEKALRFQPQFLRAKPRRCRAILSCGIRKRWRE